MLCYIISETTPPKHIRNKHRILFLLTPQQRDNLQHPKILSTIDSFFFLPVPQIDFVIPPKLQELKLQAPNYCYNFVYFITQKIKSKILKICDMCFLQFMCIIIPSIWLGIYNTLMHVWLLINKIVIKMWTDYKVQFDDKDTMSDRTGARSAWHD